MIFIGEQCFGHCGLPLVIKVEKEDVGGSPV